MSGEGDRDHPSLRAAKGAAPLVAQELGERLKALAHDANAALNGVADATGLTEKVEANPYGMMAAALGVGYVLGGGLFTPTTMRLLRMGARLATIPLVRDKLLDMAEAAIDGLVSQRKKQPPEDAAAPAAESTEPRKE